MATFLNAHPLRFFLFLFVLMQTNHFSFSQDTSFPVKEWVKKLSSRSGPTLSGFLDILPVLANKDSASADNLFNDLERRGNSSSAFFNCRLNLTKATYLHGMNGSETAVKELFDK